MFFGVSLLAKVGLMYTTSVFKERTAKSQEEIFFDQVLYSWYKANTYSPVNFTREHVGQIIFMHFSNSLVNMLVKSLVNMLAQSLVNMWT